MLKKAGSAARLIYILLILCLVHTFLISLISDYYLKDTFYAVSLSFIFIFTHLAISKTTGKRFYLPIIAIIVLWIAELMHFPVLMSLASFTTFAYFIFIIIKLIQKVAASKEVGLLEFTESIVVYLLFGIAGSLIFRNIYLHDQAAFVFSGKDMPALNDFTYFSFVTLSTLGYGDITPLTSLARSASIFFSVSGQLYMAMIVAVLVGKYLGGKKS